MARVSTRCCCRFPIFKVLVLFFFNSFRAPCIFFSRVNCRVHLDLLYSQFFRKNGEHGDTFVALTAIFAYLDSVPLSSKSLIIASFFENYLVTVIYSMQFPNYSCVLGILFWAVQILFYELRILFCAERFRCTYGDFVL